MLYLRFKHHNTVKYGIMEDPKSPHINIISNNFTSSFSISGDTVKKEHISLLAPTMPSKIVAIGLNYKDHIKELNFEFPKTPCIFLKPPSSIIGPEKNIIYPKQVTRLDYEAELAIVIGKKTSNVSIKDAHKSILGYTCLNDVTARDLQQLDSQWTRAKSFDTFCPIGPYIVSDLDGDNLTISSFLNGKEMQRANTSDFLFSIPEIVSFISQIMTLYPGDLIATGTPAGVGPMKKGDSIEVRIEKIGALKNYVV